MSWLFYRGIHWLYQNQKLNDKGTKLLISKTTDFAIHNDDDKENKPVDASSKLQMAPNAKAKRKGLSTIPLGIRQEAASTGSSAFLLTLINQSVYCGHVF